MRGLKLPIAVEKGLGRLSLEYLLPLPGKVASERLRTNVFKCPS